MLRHSDSGYLLETTPLPGTDRVFRGTRTADQRPVLVKRMRGSYASGGDAATLRHEFGVLERLRDAPVARALELSSESGSLALVLEPAPGRSMQEILGQGRPDALRFTALALAASRALASVHALGFIHRDIKPDHIFVDEQVGQATLIDFGLATALPRERHLPIEVDRLEGTLAYISPEQTGRTNHSVDRRSDLYSLGVSLYELAAGKLPFDSDDALELVHAHIARTPAALTTLRPDLPALLDAIILRLLAKSPDERYQTAAGLVADLERVQRALSSSGSVDDFELGRADHDGEVRVPEKLYGRAAPIEALLAAVGRAQNGARELTLIAGPPGVGKSALVHEVHRELVRGGQFVSGKFDQYNRGIPYSALAAACAELVRVFLASPGPKLDAWKSRLAALLGENAAVIIDVVPELTLVLGAQPPVPPLAPQEARLRFEQTFRRFLEASAHQGSPLVLFIDDLQWADSASLTILELVLTSESQSHLLVIGNFRDSELDAAHPLSGFLERLERKLPVDRIELGPLLPSDVLEFVSDALPLREQDVTPLAALIFDKTSGNPFFIGQFLKRLEAEGHLPFEPGRGFSWEIAEIAALGATDNVVDLVVNRLGALESKAQELLRLAACVGHTFRLRVLSVIAESTPRQVAKALEPAVTGGYLLPVDRNHHLLADLLAEDDGPEVDAGYRFVHDRVQQAALSTIDASERTRVHLRIGRLLLSSMGSAGPSTEQLFEVVAQLNLGREHLHDPVERHNLAQLNLRAAARAQAASAYGSVIGFGSICVELLGSHPFHQHYATSCSAHLLLAEAHYLCNDSERALELVDVIERSAKSVLDRVPARNLKTSLLTNQGRVEAATTVGLETLALLGLSLPGAHDPALGPAIGQAFGAYQMALGSRDVASLRDLPAMADPEKLALASTMAGVVPAAYNLDPGLTVLIVLSAVRLSLEHGTAPMAPYFYALYGLTHNAITNDYARGNEFGLLAIELARRPENAAARGAAEFIYACFISAWVLPARESQRHYEQAIVAGFDVGDQVHAAYSMSAGQLARLHAGEELVEVEAAIAGRLKALAARGDIINRHNLIGLERTIACLRGNTAQQGSVDGPEFSEAAFEAEVSPAVKAQYAAQKAMVRYLFGDAEGARRACEDVEPSPGHLYNADFALYHGLACAELARQAEPERREALLAKADGDLAKLAIWAKSCPHNFASSHELLRAELHAARNELSQALDAYEAAVEQAAAGSAFNHRGLAHERVARFHLRSGRSRLGHLELVEACDHYERWGARAVVARLREEFPQAQRSPAFAGERDLRTKGLTRSGKNSVAGGGSHLDLTSAIRAVEAIASELRLEPLLRRLLQILVENAGATRGVLVLAEGEAFEVRATLRVEPEEILVALHEPLEESSSLPASIVQYCARTLEPLVIHDASRDQRFARDPFVKQHRCKSITCVPLLHQGKLVGLLYLENDTATGVFQDARLERLEFLAGHAAVALQNSRLYAEVEAANASLELRVRERTAELSDRNREMRRVLDNVSQGLMTVDLHGRLSSQRSRRVDEWFGGFEAGTSFRDYVARVDRTFAETFELAFESLLEAVLPEELALSQLPATLQHGPCHFRLSYEPIHVEQQLSGLLIVVDDVTEALRRARDEAEQKEELVLCRRLSRDRSGLMGFFEEAQALVEQLSGRPQATVDVQRCLHTLKGNAAMFGFSLLAEYCHDAEDAVLGDASEQRLVERVIQRFTALRTTLASIAGDRAGDQLEVSRDAVRFLAQRLREGLPASEASREVERLLLEPLAVPLARLGEYARALSDRLGKGELAIDLADGGLLADAQKTAPLFASLVHLIRNAVDHGLETKERRVEQGKGRAVLSLTARTSGADVYIEVEDDGAGIDWERVRALAEARALPAGSREALVEALFAPEFSTRTEVTSTSGRGVGLAAVRAEVERLSGRIEVESEPGRGTLFRLRLPVEALSVQPAASESKRRQSVPPSADQRWS